MSRTHRSIALAIALFFAHAAGLASAKPAAPMASASAARTVRAESGLVEHACYGNSAGQFAHALTHTISGGSPAGASARCRDRSYSFGQHRRGTRSHHGGVAAWY